jgi:hypothetical protein
MEDELNHGKNWGKQCPWYERPKTIDTVGYKIAAAKINL